MKKICLIFYIVFMLVNYITAQTPELQNFNSPFLKNREVNSKNVVEHNNPTLQSIKLNYYSFNTIGLNHYSSFVNIQNVISLSTIHGLARDIGNAAIGMALGLSIDFLDEGTFFTLFYQPRYIFNSFSLFADLGYGFGVEEFSGFAFASGLGYKISISRSIGIYLDIGYGGKSSDGFYFINTGIAL